MKQPLRFMTIPKTFWDNEQLSLAAKWVAITIDSYVDQPHGTPMGVKAIQTATKLSAKEVKDAMTELYEHGAMEVTVCDGQKFWKPLLYRESYPKKGEKVVIGDKPSDAQAIDYQAIVDAWNENCGNLPKVERLTPKRKQKTRTTLKGSGCTEADLIKAIKLVSASAFLRGEKSDGWSASYDWLVKNPENLTKVLEGNYHKDYSERRAFETIMRGGEVNNKQEDEDYYR